MNNSWIGSLLGSQDDRPVFVLPGEKAVLTANDVHQLPARAGGSGLTLKMVSRTSDGLKSYIAALCARDMALVPAPDDAPPQRMAQISGILEGCEGLATGLAVVLTTSGSTGQPKAVGLGADALLAFTASAVRAYGIRVTDRILVAARVDGDYFLEELLLTLGSGAAGVVLPPDKDVSDADFPDWLAGHAVTVLDLPLTRWRQLALALSQTAGQLPACVRLLLLGGEPLKPADVLAARRLSAGPLDVVNLYGPTETTIVSTSYWIPADLDIIEAEAALPIGTALPRVDCYVVDENLQTVAHGVPGELLIGGSGLAHGYIGDAAGTAARFVPDGLSGLSGRRLYRTGDRVISDADGTYHFMNRLDGQVKIRGFRVEPGEIEAALMRLDSVELATVRAIADGEGRLQLVAYVPEDAADSATLRDGLERLLPDYMIPTGWVRLAEFPLTATGKIDKDSLPTTGQSPIQVASPAADVLADATCTERILVETCSSVLGIPTINPYDSFFYLGGQSREAVQVVAVLRERHHLNVGVADLLRRPVLRDLAAFIDAEPAPRPVLSSGKR